MRRRAAAEHFPHDRNRRLAIGARGRISRRRIGQTGSRSPQRRDRKRLGGRLVGECAAVGRERIAGGPDFAGNGEAQNSCGRVEMLAGPVAMILPQVEASESRQGLGADGLAIESDPIENGQRLRSDFSASATLPASSSARPRRSLSTAA